ncbi:SDR family NAD(P)-dependent oxidoreductase [Sphingomonas sp. 28-62-11]|uniref:SDR family NAD(P)-dependent oxidoreductase n=1 Tax=Sphingomonas sp. 28-62-11 TaxID=1970432 RepID=UPI000BC69394|nr:MAG: hypothetical protein B7Y49_01145 [Sphingomonas sp. 28-62-11]
MSDFNLAGKRALVTGSSEGIGLAIATKLARAGAHVQLHGIEAPDHPLAQAALAEVGERGRYTAADLADPEALETLIATTGPIDMLISTVATQVRQPLGEVTMDAVDLQFRLNFQSALQLIQAVLPQMRAKRWGRIVVIGSVQEAKPHPQMVTYAALKGAQENLVRNLALQLAADGVTVNNVAPGVIVTRRNQAPLADPEYARQVIERIPARAYGEPRDIVGAVLLLCSEAGRYITGATIPIDGGMHI